MRLTVVASNIKGGGAPLAAVNWANGWARRGHEVRLLALFPNDGIGEGWAVDQDVDHAVVDLTEHPVRTKLGAIWRLLLGMLRLRAAIRRSRPEVLISFEGPVNIRVLLATVGMRLPKVIMEQTHPGQYSVGRFWDRIRRMVYPGADVQVNLTRQAMEWCRERYAIPHAAVIPNPLVMPDLQAKPVEQRSATIVTAGRFVPQKRFDLLLEAFALLATDYPEWNLVIHGDGPDRPDLEAQAERLGLAERVRMPGWSNELARELAKGRFFVLSSEYEGFGNVIIEAMALGLPVVSFDCPSGPGEIIRHEQDGLLVEPLNVRALAEGMGRMMSDKELLAAASLKAMEARDRFSLNLTLDLWDNVLATATGQGTRR